MDVNGRPRKSTRMKSRCLLQYRVNALRINEYAMFLDRAMMLAESAPRH